MGHKYGIGDVVYSTIWNEDVRITKLNDNLFYTVRSINRYDWMMTHEGNLKSREDVIEKMMQEHQDVCDEILTIQDIDTSEFEMIEGLVEEETKVGTALNPIEPKSNANCLTQERVEELAEEEMSLDIDDFQDDNEIIDIIDEYVHRLKDDECQINLPEGYQFTDENGNVINATKIVLEKKIDKDMTENNTKVDMGEVSDGYHTFNELYEYRMLYNAALFNEFAKQGLYDVHKSRKHSDGEYPFGDSNWFIVMAELPTGQISNHYEMKDWDKFQIPEKELANKWDEHSPRDVAERLTDFTTPKKEYPKTYEECCKVLDIEDRELVFNGEYRASKLYWKQLGRLNILNKLLICRDAYWKIAGEEMGLGKPWEPDWKSLDPQYIILYQYGGIDKVETHGEGNYILTFPTEEMRDAFYENFKELIEICKEFL